MLIEREMYESCFYGFTLTDCVVRNRNILYFVASHEAQAAAAGPTQQRTVDKRIIVCFLDEPMEKRWSRQNLKGYARLHAGVSLQPLEQFVGVDADGDVYVVGGGAAGAEQKIPEDKAGPLRGDVTRLRLIQESLYLVGGFHSVCRRSGRNSWENLCANLPVPKDKETFKEAMTSMNFKDIDGFAADDLYAVAGQGNLWHYDGSSWQAVAFPSNMYLESICCAGDGSVYIGAQSGTVFKGRDNRWTLLHKGDLSLPFNDMVWHAGKVWCGNDYGLWWIDEGSVIKPDLPAEIAVCAGNLSVADGILLMAGTNGAAYHDGEQWVHIFDALQMEEQVQAAQG
ncbi:hypothetical protein [Pseudomonas sp. RIT-PI-AD]|uniref:WD40/YVTN/BNR-like repeat-containing protein n=1 Tax=Pseudomonas sp. RIT-PI-AD TaxID=3035294 RepID=UPI0021DA597B|nr:hypothetical protein [Pseudomonas sp. RIT-PI-AD]